MQIGNTLIVTKFYFNSSAMPGRELTVDFASIEILYSSYAFQPGSEQVSSIIFKECVDLQCFVYILFANGQ